MGWALQPAGGGPGRNLRGAGQAPLRAAHWAKRSAEMSMPVSGDPCAGRKCGCRVPLAQTNTPSPSPPPGLLALAISAQTGRGSTQICGFWQQRNEGSKGDLQGKRGRLGGGTETKGVPPCHAGGRARPAAPASPASATAPPGRGACPPGHSTRPRQTGGMTGAGGGWMRGATVRGLLQGIQKYILPSHRQDTGQTFGRIGERRNSVCWR